MMVDCQIQGYIKNLKYEGTSQKCQKSKAWVAKVQARTCAMWVFVLKDC